MTNNRKKNSIRNAFFGILSKIIALLLPFVIRTIIIYTLGAEYLGLTSLFSTILQVFSLADLGFGNAIVFSMYKPIAENDEVKICALLNFYKKVYCIVGLIILILGVSFTPFLRYLIAGDTPTDVNVYILYLIYILNSASSYFLFAYRSSLLSAYQRNDVIYKIDMMTKVLMYGIQILGLLIFKNYYIYIIWMPIFTIIHNVLVYIRTKKLFKNISPYGKLDGSVTHSIKVNVFALMGHKIGSVMLNSCDTVFVSAFFGLLLVSMYNNYYYIISAVEGILSIFFSAILASVGNSLVENDSNRNYSTFQLLNYLNNWITVWCTVCLAVLFQPFMKIWVGDQYCFSGLTVVLWVIFFYVHNIRNIINTYKDASGLWKDDILKPYLGVVFDVVLNILLIKKMGINGIILATTCTFVFIYIPFEIKILFRKVFPNKCREYLKSLIINTMVCILLVVGMHYLCNHIYLCGIWGLILKFGACLLIPNAIWCIITSNTSEYKRTKSLLSGIVRR